MSERIKYRYLFFKIIFLLLSLPCNGQHNIIYAHHSLHPILSNPAMTGSEFFPVVALTNQKQWIGIAQSPYTMIASGSLRVGRFNFYDPKMFINTRRLQSKERVGLGFAIYSDKNGPSINRGVNLNYAYHVAVSQSRLSFGLSGSAEQTTLNGTIWNPIDPGDQVLVNSRESFYSFNANFGVYFYSAKYFVGFAANHLIPAENKIDPRENVNPDFILHGGYLFRKSQKLKFEPSISFRYLDYELFEYDIIAKMYFNHIHWFTISYRSYNALQLNAGFKVQKFYLGYSFEANLSPIVKYSFGTHGIHVGFNMGTRRLEGF